MPIKSKAQQRFLFSAEARGELPAGTAKRWARHTKNMKNLPEKVKKEADVQLPDIPPKVDADSVPWTKGFTLGFLKSGSAKDVYKLIRSPRPMKGTTDAALTRYNAKVLANRMNPPGKTPTPGFVQSLEKHVKKIASGNMPEDAHNVATASMTDVVPGGEARDNAETGQPKQKNWRTPGVLNEDREMGKMFLKRVQTARGGKHHGGTIRSGF